MKLFIFYQFTEHQGDDRYENRCDKGRTETIDDKRRPHQRLSHHQGDRIDDKKKKPKCQKRNRQSQNDEDGLQEHIQYR